MNQTTQNQIENADFEIFNRKVSVSIDTGNVDILHDCIPEALDEAQERLENIINEMETRK